MAMNRPSEAAATYSAVARAFHWLTAALILITIPIGIAMVVRGKSLNIWDATTNHLYSAHKLIGFVILWLVVARLLYRLVHGAPPAEPSLAGWQKAVSHTVHWSLYGLMIGVAIGGWVGVSLFPALDIFGLFSLPALTAPDQAMANRVLAVHGTLGLVVGALVLLHIGAALQHHFIRKDNVLRRMIPRLPLR